jgi:hypothetical protein
VSRVLIVSCGSAKAQAPSPARELYTGSLTRAAIRYATASGLPWRILSAEHGLVCPDEVIAPYERRIESRLPFPFGPDDAVGRPDKTWDRSTRSWVEGKRRPSRDWRTPWWWQGVCADLRHWLRRPLFDDAWRPPDCLMLHRKDPVTIEVHGGRSYVAAVRVLASKPSPFGGVVEDPLAGLQLGERLRWYAERRRGALAPLGVKCSAPRADAGRLPSRRPGRP